MNTPTVVRTSAVRVWGWVGAIAAYTLLAVGGFVVPVLVDEAILAASDMSSPGELLPAGGLFVSFTCLLIVVVGLAVMGVAGMLFSLAARPGQPVKGSLASLDGFGAGLVVFQVSMCAGIGAWLRTTPYPFSASVIWFVVAGIGAAVSVVMLIRKAQRAST